MMLFRRAPVSARIVPMRTTLLLAAALLAGPVSAQSPHTHEHSFEDASKWARVFDDPARDAWQKPHEVIRALRLAPDALVADIGSGTGYFSVRLAHAVPKGRVYGVDTEPDMVKYLAERARRDGLANLVSVAGKPDDAALPARVDLVLMVDVYHHIGDREAYFGRLRKSLKPGARVAIIDFSETSRDGPPKSERIAPARVRAEMQRAGYTLAEQHRFLPNQYFLVFR
jgi:cyclopropane fatty-acyl-phospholipid synthase-like methyltransferase